MKLELPSHQKPNGVWAFKRDPKLQNGGSTKRSESLSIFFQVAAGLRRLRLDVPVCPFLSTSTPLNH